MSSLRAAAGVLAAVVLVAMGGCGMSGTGGLAAQDHCTVGGRLRLVGTGLGSSEGGAAWSPDSKKIAFPSGRTGIDLIYTVNADGTGLRLLTHQGNDSAPTWSPDGRRIAFVSEASNFTPNIFVMNANGSDQHQLTHSKDAYPGVTDPAWSPDGRKIAFIDSNSALEVMNPDGSHREVLNPTPANSWPVWSPDGQEIVFSQQANRRIQVFVVNADGSGLQQLTHTGANAFASWSPDGRHILFSHVQPKKHGRFSVQLYVMNANGTHLQRLTRGRDDIGLWAPNGHQIALTRGDRLYVTTIQCR